MPLSVEPRCLVIENLIHVLSDAIVICLWRHGIYIHEGSNAMVWRLESHYTIQKELAELAPPVAQDEGVSLIIPVADWSRIQK